MGSEYGSRYYDKGLVICLVKFAEHFKNKAMEKMIQEEGDPAIWINNRAKDHLYEIEVPNEKKWDRIRWKVEELKERCLKMGHRNTDKKYTVDDVAKLIALTRKIALMIDMELGLKPEIGY